VVQIDTPDEVIARYLRDLAERKTDKKWGKVIKSVRVLRNDLECHKFAAGEKAIVSVTLESSIALKDVSLCIYMMDHQLDLISETYVDSLATHTLSIVPGQVVNIAIEVDLNLGPGTYYVGSVIGDGLIDYDRRFPATSFFITAASGVKGAVNLFPRLIIPGISDSPS
jgi:hypothetical protein